MKFLSIFLLIIGLAFFTVNAQDEVAEEDAPAVEESVAEEVEEADAEEGSEETEEADAEEISADLLINLTTDDTWTAGMALGFADRVLEEGNDVAIFLNVRGVRIASTVISHDTHSMTEQTPHDMLAGLIENGATVIVCPVCQEKAGIADEDLLEGTTKGSPDVTIPLVMDPDVKILSY